MASQMAFALRHHKMAPSSHGYSCTLRTESDDEERLGLLHEQGLHLRVRLEDRLAARTVRLVGLTPGEVLLEHRLLVVSCSLFVVRCSFVRLFVRGDD